MDAPAGDSLAGSGFEEAEEALEMVYQQYRAERDSTARRRVHSYLFKQLETADCAVKRVVLRVLRRIRRDVVFVDCDVLSLLESRDARVRRVALKTLKMFWPLYEFDEVVVYAIRRHSMFYRLLRSNPKYSRAFARRISRWEARAEKNTAHGSTASSSPGPRRSGFYGGLAEINDVQRLKQYLEEHLGSCGRRRRAIIECFLERLSEYADSTEAPIPGIRRFRADTETPGGKVDGDFKLELLGLKGTAAYRRINRAFDRATA